MKRKYKIPANYLDSGYVLNGRFPIRNGIEAVILGLAGFYICSILPIPHFPDSWDGITWYVLIILPLMMIGAVGVSGYPLSVFILNVLHWRKNRKPYFYNHNGKAFRISAAQLMVQEPSLKNLLMDKLDQIRYTIKGPSIEYIEGKNFEFSADPSLEALQDAEDRILEKQKEEEEKERERVAAIETAAAELAAKLEAERFSKSASLNMDDIMDNIVLHEIPTGGDEHNG